MAPLLAVVVLLLAGCRLDDADDTDPRDTGIADDTDHGHDTTDTSDSGHDTSDSGHDTSDPGHDTSDTGLDTGHPHDTGDTGDTALPHACDVDDTGLPVSEDLPDLIPLTPVAFRITERVVTEADCAWVEGCVGGLGRRRLLRFDGSIANVGDGDLAYGRPEHHPELFEYSLCHGHHHFTDFAAWDLRDADGDVVAVGHKQAFCLTDSGRHLSDAPWLPRYDCDDQGITRGWYDVYSGSLDCQWVDVTDVPPGEYVLRVEIDPTDVVPETDDGNNVTSVVVTIPDVDITRACRPGDPPSTSRECGWHLGPVGACDPDEQVTVGCYDGATCAADCAGDPMVRVCEGEGEPCMTGGALAANDDGCFLSDCPRTSFPCPPSGTYTTWVGRRGADAAPVCDVVASVAPMPAATSPCTSGGPEGDRRECGWTSALSATCAPGDAMWIGCDPYTCGLDACPGDDVPDTLDGMVCAGDPMLRACAGDGPCHATRALALAEDACRGPCPAAVFTCPPSGSFTVLTAPERIGQVATCDLGYAAVESVDGPGPEQAPHPPTTGGPP